MKKKNIVTNKRRDEKMELNCNSNKVSDANDVSEFVTYPIVITEDGKISHDSSLDDFDNLSYDNDLCLKVSDAKEITLKKDNVKNMKKIKHSTHTISGEIFDSKRSKLMNNCNDVVFTDTVKFIDSPIPRKVSSCDNSETSENNRSTLFNSLLKKINKKSDLEADDEQNSLSSKNDISTVTTSTSSNESNIIKLKKGNENSATISGKANINKSSKTESMQVTEMRDIKDSNVSCIGIHSNNNIDMNTTDSTILLDDIGITVNDIPESSVAIGNTSGSNAGKQRPPEALLRCAYIQNENSQTVVFWCEELTRWAFKCQNKIMLDIREGKNWVTREIPFGSQTENQYSLYLYRNNVYMKGIHGTFGIRLFHYTLRNHFQTETNIKNTARRIVKYVNHDCNATLLFDESRLF